MKSRSSNAIDTAVGARIRNLRLRNKLSQTQLGEAIGVTFQQIQKYENGKNRVSASRLAEMAKLFDVPITAFYSEVPAEGAQRVKKAKQVDRADRVSDTNAVRLVKAFKALKDKSLKAALLRVAQEMAAHQHPADS
jgi:transcriptional regulator with XRE-family HTH domain